MIPKYLYQYTDIDALEKIYKSRTILFKRLDLLNDPYEGVVKDDFGSKYECARQSIYCSCWTSDEQESIAMWGIYKGFRGVRIKMCSRMFSKELSLTETRDGFVPVGRLQCPIETRHKNSTTNGIITINKVYGPYSISYVSTVEGTYEGAVLDASKTDISIPENHRDVKMLELGNRKVDYWKYEREWRYKVSAYSDMIGNPSILAAATGTDNEEFYLVPYEGDILEILLAPCVEENTITRLHTLLGDKYDGLVKRSKIRMQKM